MWGCWAVAGKPVSFHGSAFLPQPSLLQEQRRRCGCEGQDCYTAARESTSSITCSASLNSGGMFGKLQQKYPVAILVLTDMYSTRQR